MEIRSRKRLRVGRQGNPNIQGGPDQASPATEIVEETGATRRALTALAIARTDRARNARAAAAERSPFLGDELSAGSLGCGNDFVEAFITAQRIPARIELEIAV